ncbi:hypothetical protein [Parasitella parasitica]|uniref:Cell division control protein 24 OB domain-containing protein n=1 Tax=Parasitella parasitica TaxID=35722 RepID=A0A0B7N542_9FUNG|nr:hypothetical protein [Parasitella parasitica]
MGKAFENLVRDTQSKLHILFLKKSDSNPGRSAMVEATKIPWSWVAVSIAKVLSEYPTGLTDTVLLSILELMWEKTFIKRYKGFEKMTDEAKNRELDIYMHPKFNEWLTYSNENRQFFTNRKIRMICPPKANAPILNKYKDTSIARRHRVALIPPTELLLIMLDRNDKAFVQQELPHRIKDISKSTTFRLWLKIIHVEVIIHTTPTPSLDPTEESKSQRTDIFLVDMSSDSAPVVLSLYDKQTKLASIFRRSDYIGLYKPMVKRGPSQEVVFEYASDTVIFLMPEKEAQEASLAKINLTTLPSQDDAFSYATDPKKDIAERDEEGFLDCSSYTQRIYVHDLVHRMLNVTLLGRVVGLANNNPYIKQTEGGTGQKMDRYAIRIADPTGRMDITLWEDAGRDSRKLRVGQYVLLDHLVTSDRHEAADKTVVWYVNGSVVCGTKIYNVSTLNCLISSTKFRSIVPLWHAKENQSDLFQAEGMIVGWELYLNSGQQPVLSSTCPQSSKIDFLDYSLSDRITTAAHAICLLPRSGNDCKFCGCQIGNDVVHIFRPKPGVADEGISNAARRGWEGWLEWSLDDGTSVYRTPFNNNSTSLFLSYTDIIECYHSSFQRHVAPVPNPAIEQCYRLSDPLLTQWKRYIHIQIGADDPIRTN